MRHWSTLVLAVLIVAPGWGIMMGFKYMGAKTCQAPRSFAVSLQDDHAIPSTITGTTCDRIIFTNQDPVNRLISFGAHEDHQAYDGVTEKSLEKGQSFTIDLTQTGTFYFHDHLHDELSGSFTVTK